MMTNNETPRKKKKDLIYEQAAQLFKEKGYKAASMRELAQRVGLKVSSLYSHIGSKEELLQKICFDNAALFTEGMSAIEKTDKTVTEKIEAIIALHVDIAVQNPSSVTVFSNEWKHLSTDLSQPLNLHRFLDMRKDYEQRFRTIIQQGIDSGTLKNIDSEVALFTIITSVRWLHYWYKPSRRLDAKQLIHQISSVLLNGLKNP